MHPQPALRAPGFVEVHYDSRKMYAYLFTKYYVLPFPIDATLSLSQLFYGMNTNNDTIEL